jgi:hypothetical protein
MPLVVLSLEDSRCPATPLPPRPLPTPRPIDRVRANEIKLTHEFLAMLFDLA